MKSFAALIAASLFLAVGPASAQTTQYWDVDDGNPGAVPDGGFGDGTWDTAATNWNNNSDGSGANSVWVDGNNAVFSAGNDLKALGTPIFPYDAAVNLTAPRLVRTLTIEEGWVKFTGGTAALAIGTGATDPKNSVLIKQGATLEISNALILGMLQGGVSDDANPPITTLDGGTIRNSIVGAGSQFWGPVTLSPTTLHSIRIELTANGGTFDTPNGPIAAGQAPDDINGPYSIVGLSSNAPHASIVAMSPGTTSTTLRKIGHGEFRAAKDWTFTSLDVQQGLYRIANSANGGADTGFGAVNGTVTVAGGAVANSTNGAALGTTANLTDDGGASGSVGSSPATRSFVLSGVGDTPDTMIVLNNNWLIKSNISGPGGLMLNGWARNDLGGVPNIIGTEGELRLAGTNTYGGKTTINFGSLFASGGSAIPNTSRVEISTQSDWGKSTTAANNRTFNVATFRVDTTETVGSLAGGNATRGTVNINGAAVTLTTGADNSTSTFSGTITGAGGLSKSGTGSFTMDGVKTYTGDTKVLGGTLSTNSASLANAADVYLTTGNFFNLNFAGTDTIDSLFIDGIGQAVGTWGGAGSGATNISALLTGTGTLTVTTLPGPAGVQGDYNNNGVVDAADYVLWRNGGPLQNEVAGVTPGTVTPEDYDAWRARFGNISGSGSGSSAAAVPEPASLVLVFASLISLALTARRSR